MLNMVIIMGRLTADPELRTTQTGISVCNFVVAVERQGKKNNSNQRETDFLNVRVWRQQADFVSKHFRKGQMIMVVGELRKEAYTDKNGNKRTFDYIYGNSASFCGDRASDYGNAYNPQQGGYNMGAPVQNGQMMPPTQDGSYPTQNTPQHQGYVGNPNFSVLPDNNGDESGLPWDGALPFDGDDDALPF